MSVLGHEQPSRLTHQFSQLTAEKRTLNTPRSTSAMSQKRPWWRAARTTLHDGGAHNQW
jgi:hypothetical protein